MTTGKPGPLDGLIKQVVENADFLTEANVKALYGALPARQIKGSEELEISSLKRLLNSQFKMHEKIQSLALSSTDIGEMSKVMASSKQLMDLMIRFESKIEAQDRQIHIENAVVEAFDLLGNTELKDKFMTFLREKLAKKAT